ncbi:branched-chain amino acid ABC transporter permease [Nocardiopsis sp. TSRI0078]|uniref:AzlC family ABC transporter permease n=1 Tax=unclassified Nocardiopsis TaxID=2649073 RepID=UPI0009405EC6|nr:AzlC family ABC transporter permease [Nocardiopsis sp. TSRI0078]OKI17838.1 branched-chain amino acid ABC transporter permease [Nocardiopsis sp. TSRI0078]
MRDSMGIGVAVGAAGLAFGTASVTAGLSPAQSVFLSLFMFTGASQFALVGVVAGGGSLVAGALGALLLGARNTLYGLRLADVLGWRGARRALAAHGVIDETAAVTLVQPDRESARTAFVTTYAVLGGFWVSTTLVGALATERVSDVSAFGLDAVGPAIFLGLLWPRLREGGGRTWLIALLGAGLALAATPLLPSGVPVLLAASAALVALIGPDTGANAPAGSSGAPPRGAGSASGPGESRPEGTPSEEGLRKGVRP